MAAGEVYRLEIPIVTRGAEEAFEKLRTLDKAVEQIKRRAQALDRVRVSPAAKLNDQVTSPLRRIEGALRSVASRTRTVTVRLRDQVTRPLKRVQKALTSVPAMLGIGAGVYSATAFAGDSLRKAMAFEAQMSSIRALTGATNEELAKLTGLALEMGARTKYSALEAAQGMEELLKAGMTVEQVVRGGLEAALSLAAAGDLELAEAAEIMSTAMNAFRRDNLSAARAADILAGAANASATSVHELRYSLAMVSAVASNVGMSLEDTATALGIFANYGLKGSDAGTSLKTMLMNLIPQTKKQIQLFRELGWITKQGNNVFFDARGRLKSLAEIADILNRTLGGLTEEQRLSVLQEAFGSDAIRAANILFRAGAKGVRDFKAEMNKVTALDVAVERMNNAAGAVEQFNGALETLQIAGLLPALPLVKQLALWAADLSEELTPKAEQATKGFTKLIQDMFGKEVAPQFRDMDTADKINYLLDLGIQRMEAWLDGPGGEKVKKVFRKLAEIAFEAWWSTLKGLLRTSFRELLEGDFAEAGGLFALAIPLGGLRVAGAGARAAGWLIREGWKLFRARRVPPSAGAEAAAAAGKTAAAASAVRPRRISIPRPRLPRIRLPELRWPVSIPKPRLPKIQLPRLSWASELKVSRIVAGERAVAVAGRASIGSLLARALGGLSRLILPATLLIEAVNVARAPDKVMAASRAVGGLGGAWAGAKAGAALGTPFGPVGAAIGGIGGAIAGGLLGEQIAQTVVGWVRRLFGGAATAPAGGGGGGQGAAPNLTAQAQQVQQALSQAAARIRAAVQPLAAAMTAAASAVRMLYGVVLAGAQRIGVGAALAGSGMVQVATGSMLAGAALFRTAASATMLQAALFTATPLVLGGGLAVSRQLLAAAMGAALLSAAVFGAAGMLAGATRAAIAPMGLIAVGAAALSGALLAGAWRISRAVDRAVAALNRVSAPPAPSRRYARGGVVRRRHLALVGEEGPEAIIPLSPHRRRRALDLWEQVGEYLGVMRYAEGGIAGPAPKPQPVAVAVPAGGGPVNVQVTAQIGNVVLGEDEDALAMEIGYKILRALKQQFENRL